MFNDGLTEQRGSKVSIVLLVKINFKVLYWLNRDDSRLGIVTPLWRGVSKPCTAVITFQFVCCNQDSVCLTAQTIARGQPEKRYIYIYK